MGRVWDCMLCTGVSEEGGYGEGVGSEAPSMLGVVTVCRSSRYPGETPVQE